MKPLFEIITMEQNVTVYNLVANAIKEVGGTLAVLGISGSHLHGTADSQSDVDFRAWYLPSKSAIFSSRACQTIKLELPDNMEVEIKPLTSFTECIEKTDTNLIDFLFAPDCYMLYMSDLWCELKENRQLALSKSLTGMMEYMETHCATYERKIKTMRELEAILATLNRDAVLVKDAIDIGLLVSEGLVELVGEGKHQQVAFKDKKFNISAPAEQIIYGLEKKYKDYGQRMALTERNGYDSKALSHIVRVGMECNEIARTGHLELPLQPIVAKQILAIKRDVMTQDKLDDIQTLLVNLRQSFDEAMIRASLPDVPDHKRFEEIIINYIFK